MFSCQAQVDKKKKKIILRENLAGEGKEKLTELYSLRLRCPAVRY